MNRTGQDIQISEHREQNLCKNKLEVCERLQTEHLKKKNENRNN